MTIIKKQEQEMEQKIWQVERDRKLEEIAKKKLELKRITEQRQVFSELERKKNMEVNVIKDIIKKQ